MGCSPEEDEDGDEDESRNGSLALCPYATRRVTLVESRKTREGECLEKKKGKRKPGRKGKKNIRKVKTVQLKRFWDLDPFLVCTYKHAAFKTNKLHENRS